MKRASTSSTATPRTTPAASRSTGSDSILYGCGDFLNDYEGIHGYEEFRGDLTLMYFATLEPASGRLRSLRMTPMRVRRFQENRASASEAEWLRQVLSREGERFGTHAVLEADDTLTLRWD